MVSAAAESASTALDEEDEEDADDEEDDARTMFDDGLLIVWLKFSIVITLSCAIVISQHVVGSFLLDCCRSFMFFILVF